ncbi:MAG: hypothetical protein ACM3NQ_00480 [Bacteroidales bacterium]
MSRGETVFDHTLAHAAPNASRVRIVPTEELEEAHEEMAVLFPHEAVLDAPMGCRHVCVYTTAASASLIDERIREHRTEIEHLPRF